MTCRDKTCQLLAESTHCSCHWRLYQLFCRHEFPTNTNEQHIWRTQPSSRTCLQICPILSRPTYLMVKSAIPVRLRFMPFMKFTHSCNSGRQLSSTFVGRARVNSTDGGCAMTLLMPAVHLTTSERLTYGGYGGINPLFMWPKRPLLALSRRTLTTWSM